MDRHKQQIKRDRQDLKRRAVNAQNKSKMRTLIKNVMCQDDAKKATEPYASAISFIDKMASKNLIHKNNAARQKSRLTNYLNSLSA
jgi:small subunit ribosomal protein S20|tara:strand:+ start:12083 stop:12340 length:258 start_codon:yes stop_codon:yes gene_type:complete